MSIHSKLFAVAAIAAASSVPSAALACDQCEGKKQRGQWQAVSTQVIQASPEQVMAVIGDFHQWPEWTAWSHARDPEAEWTFDGQPGQVGHSMVWEGKELGKGRMELTELRGDGLEFDLWFGRSKKANQGDFTLLDTDEGTVVTWTTQGSLGLLARPFRGSIERAVNADFAQGLAALEERVEASAMADDAPVTLPSW